MALADRANQYIDERKPWVLAKDPKAVHEVVAVCTLGLNLFRSLIVFLKPIIPGVAERAEKLLGPGRVKYVHPDCGFWMLKRNMADGKIRALVKGRDLYEGR